MNKRPLFTFRQCLPRACSHGGGEPREGDQVPHLPEVRKTWPSHATLVRWGEV